MKSDILILLIGTSPMPNLISIAKRMKRDGILYLICSKETKEIGYKLKKLMIEKFRREDDKFIQTEIIDNAENPIDVYSRINEIFDEILKDKEELKEKTIELNFTGGTKVMSCTAYNQFINRFKKQAKNVVTTYLDSEKSQIIIKDINRNEIKVNEFKRDDDDINIGIKDICKIHFKRGKRIKFNDFSSEIKQLNYILYEKLFEELNRKDAFIKLLKEFREIGNEEKFKKDYIIEIGNRINKAIEESEIDFGKYNNFNEIVNEYKGNDESISKKKLELMEKDLTGIWLENGLFRYLNGLKEKGYIDDVVNSLRRKKGNSDEMEVDLVVLKNYKLYVISVTTSAGNELSKHKLYEVKLRAEQIAGTEARIGLVCFANSKRRLEKEIKNIWGYNQDKTFICTWNELNELEEDLKNWLCKGEKVNE